eukprot:scaffold20468_cov100-Cylindrotheca_fusiformis.AAC.1
MHGVLFHMLKGMPLLQHQDLENEATAIEASRTPPSAGRSFIHRTDPLSTEPISRDDPPTFS